MTLFGYDQGVFSGVVVTQDFLNILDLAGPSKTQVLSTVTAIYDVGYFLGAIVAFGLGERLGRKKAILWGTSIMAIGRVVLGLGNGINTATAPIWQTETSTAKWRGKLVILEMWTNIGGFMLVNWINYGLSFAGGAIAWRFLLALQFIFIFILWVTVPWLPESPRTLYEDISFSIEYERQNAMRWRDIFRHPEGNNTKPLRHLLLGAGTQFIQQFEGINIMSYYLPTALESVIDLSNSMARLISAANASVYFIFSGAAVPLVERMGRRGLMMMSTAGQGLALLIITILLAITERTSNSTYSSASVDFFFVFYIFFGLGMLGVPWLYPRRSARFPCAPKPLQCQQQQIGCRITNFVIVEITPIGIQNIGWKFWIVWSIFNVIFLLDIYFFYPETANRTLEDMDAYYRSNPSLVVSSDLDAISVKRPSKYIENEEEIIRQTVCVTGISAKEIGEEAFEHVEGA
ncbi:hypothetical protein UA08_06778 [Talaromyces atroroseus]|uniref:Major facilitator superfamily (MFS) profile domain-containing protein n=1 Tax=Talaromyces atroroseus TaxID=1441469 RepID=A0A225AAN4_TALAT|nr:hypothetical protein UA08_06778 [Talaromyces atroroseus]OKL57932.1 hypothetical protein UA08_06778 [Talaromyces atroroseus]